MEKLSILIVGAGLAGTALAQRLLEKQQQVTLIDSGQNNSTAIAAGISKVLAIPIVQKSIKKIKHTESQTKKDRFQRWENVAAIFGGTTRAIPFQHIAIVDDVVTTGATIEALSRELLANNPELKISIISLAIAK